MREELEQKAESYASLRNARITDHLGAGVQGIVFVFTSNSKRERYAVKIHQHREPYQRECAVYARLKELAISRVLDFHVPRIIRSDDAWLAIEMTIVTQPFVLDFASAYLDAKPQFSEDILNDWEARAREKFGHRWPTVQRVLMEFEESGIYLLDPTPGNIAFRD
jgi:hypothetical protein